MISITHYPKSPPMKNYVFAAVMLCLSYSNAITAQNPINPKIDSLEREIEIQKKIKSLEYELLLLKNEPLPIPEPILIRRKRNAQNGLGVGIALTATGIPILIAGTRNRDELLIPELPIIGSILTLVPGTILILVNGITLGNMKKNEQYDVELKTTSSGIGLSFNLN